jgi:hypothetical protein
VIPDNVSGQISEKSGMVFYMQGCEPLLPYGPDMICKGTGTVETAGHGKRCLTILKGISGIYIGYDHSASGFENPKTFFENSCRVGCCSEDTFTQDTVQTCVGNGKDFSSALDQWQSLAVGKHARAGIHAHARQIPVAVQTVDRGTVTASHIQNKTFGGKPAKV